MNKEEFILEVEKLGIVVDELKIAKLEKFYNLLIEWNNKINLTTIVERENVYLKHFYDSLTLFKEVNLNASIKFLSSFKSYLLTTSLTTGKPCSASNLAPLILYF